MTPLPEERSPEARLANCRFMVAAAQAAAEEAETPQARKVYMARVSAWKGLIPQLVREAAR